jgi:hypothetical protein
VVHRVDLEVTGDGAVRRVADLDTGGHLRDGEPVGRAVLAQVEATVELVVGHEAGVVRAARDAIEVDDSVGAVLGDLDVRSRRRLRSRDDSQAERKAQRDTADCNPPETFRMKQRMHVSISS